MIGKKMITEGKWKVHPRSDDTPQGYCYDIMSDDGWHIASIAGGADSNEIEDGRKKAPFEEDEANARLIAEAPETAKERDKLKAVNAKLLEACKKTKQLLNEVAEMNIQPFPCSAVQLNRDLITLIKEVG